VLLPDNSKRLSRLFEARIAAIAAAFAGVAMVLTIGAARVASQTGGGDPLAGPMTADDVTAVLAAAAAAISDTTMAAAVVDRTGAILGVYRRSEADATTADVAVSLARTGAFFSNNAAPLSSRTVRFISGIHFPPGVSNTANAGLYGIENTNRGCSAGTVDAIFTALPRPRGIQGTPGAAGLLAPPLPCQPADTRGCAQGGAILDGTTAIRSGITTGKRDVRDTGDFESTVNPGGTPLYRNGEVVGGVGVAGVSPDRADFAAVRAAAANGRAIVPVFTFPNELPTPGAAFIDGIRLPFFQRCLTVQCVRDAVTAQRPTGSSAGTFSFFDVQGAVSGGRAAPEGYLFGPRSGSGGLTADDVARIIDQAVATANTTRAVVRLPYGQTTRMVISVSDTNGEFLAIYRMPDATMFSVDVAMAKARNAHYFSTRAGYDVLRSYVTGNPYDRYTWEPDPPAGKAWAITNRTLSFAGQPLFPPGIDLEKPPTPGPWFDLFRYDSQNACTEGPGPDRGGNRAFQNQSGIVWFPGSAPLYKGATLVGGVGVSGDGVEQDDFVTAAAAAGFEPPPELRVDQSVIRTGSGALVRLPYFKFPRNPAQR
jgi:uncharacterized protein GlcG (DUF336 family)